MYIYTYIYMGYCAFAAARQVHATVAQLLFIFLKVNFVYLCCCVHVALFKIFKICCSLFQ